VPANRQYLPIVSAVTLTALLLVLQAVRAQSVRSDPFAFFQPTVFVRTEERNHLDRGQPIARTLPARASEVAVFAAVPTDADGDRLVAWVRSIAALKRSSYVLAIGRFSDPPRLDDLAALTLDDEELSAVRRCRPGDCAFKLASAEMAELQHAPDMPRAFREILLRRVRNYLSGGRLALPAYDDHHDPVRPAARLAALVGHTAFLTERLPGLVEYLENYPHVPMPEIESFLYWSKERLAGKAMVGVTHVSILRSHVRGAPDAIIIGQQIYATRYVNGELAVTALLRGAPGTPNYLVYLNRSDVDPIGGVFSGIARWFVQRRLTTDAGTVLLGVRERLESGEPNARGPS
jgi:hypothetical protein